MYTLTAIETACGVTIEDVKREAARALVRPDGRVYINGDTGPALAGATVRYLVGTGADYLGANSLGHNVYG